MSKSYHFRNGTLYRFGPSGEVLGRLKAYNIQDEEHVQSDVEPAIKTESEDDGMTVEQRPVDNTEQELINSVFSALHNNYKFRLVLSQRFHLQRMLENPTTYYKIDPVSTCLT